MFNTKKTLTVLFGLSLLTAPLLGSAQAKGGVCRVVYYGSTTISECAPTAPTPDAGVTGSTNTASNSNSNSNKPVKP